MPQPLQPRKPTPHPRKPPPQPRKPPPQPRKPPPQPCPQPQPPPQPRKATCMPDWEFPRSSLSKRWNVARLTSEISSSSRVGTRNGAVSCQRMSATDPAVGATRDAAGDPPVDAAKDTPAMPRTDTVFLVRFPFETRFACGIAVFLPYFPSTNPTSNVLHPLALFCDAKVSSFLSPSSVERSPALGQRAAVIARARSRYSSIRDHIIS